MSKWIADRGNGLFLLDKADVQLWNASDRMNTGCRAKWCSCPIGRSIMKNLVTTQNCHGQMTSERKLQTHPSSSLSLPLPKLDSNVNKMQLTKVESNNFWSFKKILEIPLRNLRFKNTHEGHVYQTV